MKTYHFENNFDKEKSFESNLYFKEKKSFLLLGSDVNTDNDSNTTELELKINRASFVTPETIWGTLGWKGQDNYFDLKGKIHFSEYGIEHYKESKNEQVRNIWTINPLSQSSNFSVLERTINLDDILFDLDHLECTYEDIPALRLTLFIQPEEGAIVYYEHNSPNPSSTTSPVIEFILPQEKKDKDRQDYYIPINPKFDIDYNELNKKLILTPKKETANFTIKILTFQRHDLIPTDLFHEAKNQINLWTKTRQKKQFSGLETLRKKAPRPIYPYLGDSKYAMWKFDANNNTFIPASFSKEPEKDLILFNKKTLLLIHGTFSDTPGSYGKLYNTNGTVLKELMDKNHYQQIIAFDHPTISRNVFDNSHELYRQIGSNHFDKPVDILGYSRGGLLSKWLACDDNPAFKVGKILNFSPAKGVGYFEKAEYVGKVLSVMKYLMPSAVGKLITFLAQESASFFLDQPGCLQMKPDSLPLTKVLDAKFKHSSTSLKNIAADWDKSLINSFILRIGGTSFDNVLKYILGSKHDWVVGFEEQKSGPHPYQSIVSMHTKNFDKDYVASHDIHKMIYDFFT